MVGTTTSVRSFAGTPSRSSSAGRILAPKRLVMLVFASAIAASTAMTIPQTARATNVHAPLPALASATSGHARMITESSATPAM